MSLKDHPNFHALNFVTEIMSAYYESLRGKASVQCSPDVREEIIEFCAQIEKKVDLHVLFEND